jgi:hypothetical protein
VLWLAAQNKVLCDVIPCVCPLIDHGSRPKKAHEFLNTDILCVILCNNIVYYIIMFSINFAYQMSFRAFWLAYEMSFRALTGKSDAWLFSSGLVNNAFQKERFGKFGFKIDEILETIVPRKRKKHKMLYLTWNVGLLYYFTASNIFTNNFKLI